MTFRESLQAHRQAGRALLAANFYNLETLQAIVHAAHAAKQEVILQISPSTVSYLGGPRMAVAMARAAARQENVQAWLHLDHAASPDLIQACIDLGYDSVMIDASDKDFAANVDATRRIVALAHAAGVAVEAELGYVPKLGQASPTEATYTAPAEAAEFIRQTHVDLLAVAIGTAHGFYKQAPRLDLDRLALIHQLIDTPLVLHGGSGLSEDQWRQTIRRGVCKINFATEIKNLFMRELKTALNNSDDIDLRRVFPPAIAAVTKLVSRKIQACGG